MNHVVNVCDVILQRGNHFNSFILRDSCRRLDVLYVMYV